MPTARALYGSIDAVESFKIVFTAHREHGQAPFNPVAAILLVWVRHEGRHEE